MSEKHSITDGDVLFVVHTVVSGQGGCDTVSNLDQHESLLLFSCSQGQLEI
jgi:hypothetical protein